MANWTAADYETFREWTLEKIKLLEARVTVLEAPQPTPVNVNLPSDIAPHGSVQGANLAR